TESMRIVFVGPVGAGKGTQAKIVCGRLGVPPISPGDSLPAATGKGKPPAGLVAAMSAGALVPDDVVVALIDERTQEADCLLAFWLHGLPRTTPQARALDRMVADRGLVLERVVSLEVRREVLIERAVL